MCELLIFGGTTEGRELARYCCEKGIRAAVSVATEYGGELLPKHELLHILTGRLDSDAMTALMKELGCTAVIDATHPYAEEVTANILRACRETGIVCHRLLRSPSALPECLRAEDMDGLIKLIDSCGGNVLSTLGSKSLPALSTVRNYRERIWVRVLPGVEDVIANFLLPVSILIRLDLPTLLLPIKAYSGKPVLGHLFTSVLLITNSALVIFIVLIQ